jgi:hypothetical protein
MFFALSPIQRYWLIGLLIIWGALLFGGFLFHAPIDETRRMPAWTRMASSATLVLAAFSWYAFVRGTPASSYALLIAMGMAFGFVGDLLLAGVLPFGAQFIPGLVSFGIGHIFYITAMLRFGAAAGLMNPAYRWGALAFWLFVGLLGWYFVVYRGALAGGGSPSLVHWLALPYALLLAATTGVATGLALQDGRFILLALGAGLFLISDLILAGNKFSGLSLPLVGDVIWLTYGPAQMLIVYSIGYALSRLTE